MTAPTFDGTFEHRWTAEILPNRPMILPSRHFVYPALVEEVERGALEVLIQPEGATPFLATCALGFRDPKAPTGLWAMPDPEWLCAVSGGYAYLIDTAAPERFVHLRYRPVLEVLTVLANDVQSGLDAAQSLSLTAQSLRGGLILFVGHVSILAWGREGEVWESPRLSWEGLTGLRIDGDTLYGLGWDMKTDKDLPFTLDLRTGLRIPD
jgi:hypothetical protein